MWRICYCLVVVEVEVEISSMQKRMQKNRTRSSPRSNPRLRGCIEFRYQQLQLPEKIRGDGGEEQDEEEKEKDEAKIVCLGGGAGAEMLAFAVLLRVLQTAGEEEDNEQSKVLEKAVARGKRDKKSLKLHVVDMADWTSVTAKLQMAISAESLTTTSVELQESSSSSVSPPASSSASPDSHHHSPPRSSLSSSSPSSPSSFLPPPSTTAPSQPLVSNFNCSPHHLPPLTFTYQQIDLLELADDTSHLAPLLAHAPLVTLMFTLNEMYTVSMARTTAFLMSLTFLMSSGSLLLVVDSPGSYSNVEVGKKTTMTKMKEEQKNHERGEDGEKREKRKRRKRGRKRRRKEVSDALAPRPHAAPRITHRQQQECRRRRRERGGASVGKVSWARSRGGSDSIRGCSIRSTWRI